MRIGLVFLAVAACGGGAKEGGSRVVSGNEDLHIPAVNPELCNPKGKKVALYDLNHDGKTDYVAQYDEAGNIILEEYDFDFDGHFDARIYFDKKTGKKYLIERMSGFGEQP